MANNLSLISNEKLSQILDYIKNEQLLKQTTASPESLELLESHEKVKKSVKKRSSQVENDKVNFQNKRQKYRDYVKSIKDDKGDDEVVEPEKKGKQLTRANVEAFFKQHNIKKTQKGLTFGSKAANINYSDLIEDLVTDNRKTNKNLTDAQLDQALSELDDVNFPAKYIRDDKVKKRYKNIKEKKAKQKVTPTGAGPSRIPIPHPPQSEPPSFRRYSYQQKTHSDSPTPSTPKRASGRDVYHYTRWSDWRKGKDGNWYD